jgi:hypothetical protein
MKTKLNFYFLLPAVLTIICYTACSSKDDDEPSGAQTKTFISSGANDGFIENLTNRVVHDFYSGPQGKSINIGWNSDGYCMRGFLSFDVSDIMPTADKELIIDKVLLQVYEANTNMHPFDGVGKRGVNCFLVNYGALDKNDYDLNAFANCGTITSWGYNVLKEYPLIVTSTVNDFIKAHPTENKIQFRLQFVPDGNVQKPSPLTSSMWNIFSGDETQKPDYRPKLTITYHHQKKN